MSKIKLAVALSILATFAVPVAAQAAPAPDLTSKVILTEHGDDNEFDSEDGEDSEDGDYEDGEDGEDSFGGTVDDNDGDRDVPMPSIVIDPNGLGHPHGGPQDPYDITRVNPGDGPLGTVNPRDSAPIFHFAPARAAVRSPAPHREADRPHSHSSDSPWR